jgi:hypothetical protein
MTLQKPTQDKADQMINDQKKLLDLEKLKYKTKDEIKEFRRNNKNYFHTNNPKIFSLYFPYMNRLNIASKNFKNFKSHLEKKYNFEFPLDCSGSNSTSLLFTKFFKDRFIDEVKL